MTSTAATANTGAEAVAGYANAILDVARAEGVVDRVEDELYSFARALESTPELRERLADSSLDVSTRLKIVDELLGDKAHPQTVAGIAYVIQSGRGRLLLEIADEAVRLAAAARERVVAEVRSAIPLDEVRQEKLTEAIAQATGRQVELRVTVDPKVVGGLLVKIGDTVIDGSIARRLSELRVRLTGG